MNSGSEANELALRLVRTATGATDVVCLQDGYHGHTQALVDVSPYKHDGPGGRGTAAVGARGARCPTRTAVRTAGAAGTPRGRTPRTCAAASTRSRRRGAGSPG